jgi:hypothetical protein
MAIKLGLDAKIYLGGSEMTNVKNVTLNLEKGEADVTTRGAQGWRATLGTLKDGSVEFEMIWDDEDGAFNTIQSAFFSGDPVAMQVLDGEGGSGLDADFSVIKFTRNEPLEEAITASVTVKPTYSTRAPAWV